MPAAKELRAGFRRLSGELKASDRAVRGGFDRQVHGFLGQYRAELSALEGLLGHSLEKLESHQDGEELVGIASGELALSVEQVDVLLATLNRPRTWRDGAVGRLGRRTVHALRRARS